MIVLRLNSVPRKERSMTDSLGKSAQSRMIDLPAGRFHYVSWGAEQTELPSVLLLHGITSSAQSWVRVGPELAEWYRVYALDMRGHGDSIKPPRGAYSLRHTADDAVAFIETLGLQRPVLIGHSWGGATAIVLASGAWSQKPGPTLSHLILEDPAYHFGSGDPEERDKVGPGFWDQAPLASTIAVAPPQECPISTGRCRPRVSINATASSAVWRKLYAPRGGFVL